jgi:hypothetical protein
MASFDKTGKIVDSLVQPLIVGAASYGASMLAFSDMGYMYLPAVGNVSWHVGMGLIGASASVVNELAHNYILPKVARGERLANMESMLLAPVVSGASAVMIPSLLNPNIAKVGGNAKLFLVGAGAEILGNYVFSAFVEPYLVKTK